ncbi:CRISPR-associated protein CasA/Cse1 [Planctomycetes bacterium Pan216]|uniref:CRISPR-associated protein CasA/Cse1 n=1 Tax=Kolteria novifilia TaxID=2527975 RepID=A0A518B0G1_9BACT|nr:CRISPR-associated protein CasA/Cse1 [Planctomycetes bacterium Pan216]
MTQPSFNLIDEPFIPCVRLDGTPVELGIHDTLINAHELREIHDDSPLVTFALHRLLLAILHRVHGPPDRKAWKTLWDRGRFDPDPLADYLTTWRHRFDLFDEKYPFIQDRSLDLSEAAGVARLAAEHARGNNATLFDHTNDAARVDWPSARTARSLIAEQGYAIGGGRSKTGNLCSGPLLGGAVHLPVGSQLFTTLLLNLVRYDEQYPVPATNDAPCWELDDPNDGPSTPRGYLDHLTWMSRRIRLEVDQDGTTIGAAYSQGRVHSPEIAWNDPHMAYRRNKELGYVPMRLSENRAVWRDSNALFVKFDSESHRQPAVIAWLAELTAEGVLDSDFTFDLMSVGLCTDKAKINFWRNERLPLPLDLLVNEQLIDGVDVGLNAAEAVGRVLSRCTYSLAVDVLEPEGDPPDKDRARQMVASLGIERVFWSRLELPFRTLLLDLAHTDPNAVDLSLATWAWHTVRGTAIDAFDEATHQLDQDSRLLRAVVRGRSKLRAALAKEFSDYKEILNEEADMAG